MAEPAGAAGLEGLLEDFVRWLRDGEVPDPLPTRPTIDFSTLLAQFTALRHDVNLQTKAARAAVEANAETLRQLGSRSTGPAKSAEEDWRPLLKALLEVADALERSHEQVQRLGASLQPLLQALQRPAESSAPPGCWLTRWARWLRGARAHSAGSAAPAEQAAEKLSRFVQAAEEGYALSRRRMDRLLSQWDVERIAAVGQAFDPECMEAVERVEGCGRPAGEVIEEVTAGYRWKGRLLRSARVRVAANGQSPLT